jgi:hypothetical protein
MTNKFGGYRSIFKKQLKTLGYLSEWPVVLLIPLRLVGGTKNAQ